MRGGFAEWLGALGAIASGLALWGFAATSTRPDWAPPQSGWGLSAFGIFLALGGFAWAVRILTRSEYEADFGRVRAHSVRVRADLERHGRLNFSDTHLTVDREVGDVAHSVALGGPLLLVGEAGSGKSAVLADLAARLEISGSDVLIFDSDAVNGGSLGELSRELQLDHSLTEVLNAWPGRKRRYLLVDGLDETRGVPSVPTLRRLIESAAESGGWIPIAAVRRFDLRYSSKLKAVFAGKASAEGWADSEFGGVRHTVVGDLSDAELDQLRPAASSLVDMTTHPGVGPLLRRPIHLQLAADLLARGGGQDVIKLRTQVELLHLYWERIVESPADRRAGREAVITTACRLAIADQRLTMARSALDRVGAEGTIDVLGIGLLVEGEADPGTSRPIRFLHALVADYAIARLVLRPSGAVESLLLADPVNALFLRRSMELWLTGLWEASPTRSDFWAIAMSLCERDEVPEIAKLIAPTIAAESWTVLADLDPLLTGVASGSRAPAIAALRHLVASLTAPPHPPVAGPDASPWSALAVRLARDLAEDLAFPTRLLVMVLSDARVDLTSAQLSDLGEAARLLLTWLWDRDSADTISVRLAIKAVCSSLASDEAASEAVLRRGLCRRHVGRRGYDELSHYADHIEDLEQVAGLVEALYTAAFAFADAGAGQPVNLGGPVLSLVSDRAQEFRMARYVLGAGFGALMDRQPKIATRSLLRVLRASRNVRSRPYDRGPYLTFSTAGIECRVRDEWSAQSVAGIHPPDDEATLIASWASGLADLIARDEVQFADVVAAFLSANRSFGGWRILIDVATRDESLQPQVVRLLSSAPPVLSASSLADSICRLAVAVRDRPELISELRVGLGSIVDPVRRAALAACLDDEPTSLAFEDDNDDESVIRPRAETTESPSPNSTLEAWCGSRDDGEPVPPEVQIAFAELASSLDQHDDANESDWYLASRVAARLSRTDHNCDTGDGRLLATVFERVLDSTADSQAADWDGDDEVGSVPRHACVLYAVEGIARLWAMGQCDEVLTQESVKAISAHPLPWARLQLARSSEFLVFRDPDLAWSIVDQLADDSANRVAASAIQMAIRFRRQNPGNSRALLDKLSTSRRTPSKLVGEASLVLAGILTLDGVENMDRFQSTLASAHELSHVRALLHSMRSSIAPPDSPNDAESVRQHLAALSILRAVLSLAAERYSESREGSDTDADAHDRALDAVRVLDVAVSEIYFASGAFRGSVDEPHPTADQMAGFFDELAGDVCGLLTILPAPAVHHVVEFAAANAEARPTEAFLLVSDAVGAARAVGYATDTLAKDLVLGLVREYLADRSELFQGSSATARSMQAALVATLDSFVAVGWPEARSMAYHLGELLG